MPKELYEIKSFNKGTLSTPSQEDIPPESAAHSLNIDPTSTNGILKSINTDESPFGSTTASNCNADAMAILEDTSTPAVKSLVAYDENSGSPKIKQASPYDSADFVDIESIGGGTNASMVRNNKEIHLGVGNNHPSKWVGYTNHTQFGFKDTDLVIEDSIMQTPDDFAEMHKVVETTSYVFGIRWYGDRIYKWNKSSKTMVSSALGNRFDNTTAICLGGGDGYSNQENATYLWIWDYDTTSLNPLGRIYKISTATLEIIENHPVASFDPKCRGYVSQSSFNSGTDGAYLTASEMRVTDMIEAGDYLWISFFSNKYSDDYHTPGVTTYETVNNCMYFDQDSYPLLNLPISTTFTSATNVLTFDPALHDASPVYKEADSRAITPTLPSSHSGVDSAVGYYV